MTLRVMRRALTLHQLMVRVRKAKGLPKSGFSIVDLFVNREAVGGSGAHVVQRLYEVWNRNRTASLCVRSTGAPLALRNFFPLRPPRVGGNNFDCLFCLLCYPWA